MTDALRILQTAIEASLIMAIIIVVAVFALLAWGFRQAFIQSRGKDGQGPNHNEKQPNSPPNK